MNFDVIALAIVEEGVRATLVSLGLEPQEYATRKWITPISRRELGKTILFVFSVNFLEADVPQFEAAVVYTQEDDGRPTFSLAVFSSKGPFGKFQFYFWDKGEIRFRRMPSQESVPLAVGIKLLKKELQITD